MTKRTRQRTRSTHEKQNTRHLISKREQDRVSNLTTSLQSPPIQVLKRRAPPGSVSPPHPHKTRRRTRSVTHEIEEEDASTQSADDAEPK